MFGKGTVGGHIENLGNGYSFIFKCYYFDNFGNSHLTDKI